MNISSNEAWKKIFDKYDIVNKVKEDGQYKILSKQIKEFREPRLMSKWDSSESLPSILEKSKINILPDSRSSYVLGNFQLYEKVPALTEHVTKMQKVEIPDFETIDVNNISSESNAINLLVISNVLDDFLEVDQNVQTFNGRMGTGEFSFVVNTRRGKENVFVKNAQCEIDGGFENEESVVILEAKNVVYPDFHIRQLYYPYRLWQKRVKKPIRLVFSVYSNMIYRLFEYEFQSLEDYSSIQLVKERNYSLQDTEINNEELLEVYHKTNVKTDDNMNNTDIPFVQADSFERVISLLEHLYENCMTTDDIAELMQFKDRQSYYYFNAGKYLRLFEKTNDENTGKVVAQLTSLGERIYKLNYKARQLSLVKLILEHKIFHEFFIDIYNNGEFPSKEIVKSKMREYNVCGESQIDRRSGSVLSWLKWIFTLSKV
ncbi:type II restriction enzyme [Paucisalibacillus globulus]|uniref:type II restriction enzyme n=1 Tax=Paucisalibacillus globulus TaxID=351095 RepID=UPI000BB79BC4|nr:type II restriction endonuclease [Paucisalibacillus globulus]